MENQPKKRRGRPPKAEQPYNVLQDTDVWQEIASISSSLTDYVTQYGINQIAIELSPKMLEKLLRNPYANIKSVRYASKLMTTKHGFVKEVLRAIQTLPTLNYHLAWSSYDNPKQIRKYEEKINKFLDTINVKKFVRDGLYETAEMGSIVCVLRGKTDKTKYVQFLDLDDVRINRMENGKWVIEYDLQRIKLHPMVKDNTSNLIRVIESLPDEITVERYNLYRNKGEDYRFVPLSNAEIISIDAPRNVPYGLPYTIGAWYSIMQKELIDRLERSQANTLIKKIIVMFFKSIEGKPPKKEMVEKYFKAVSDVLKKRDGGYYSSINDIDLTNELVGTGVISLPEWIELQQLNVSAEVFPKHLYDKILSDISYNLGISKAIVSGEGGTFSAAQANISKFFKYINMLLEKFEEVINTYINQMLPANLSCKLFFERLNTNERKDYIANCKDLYQQTGVIKYWAEAVTGLPMEYLISQARYEKEVLKIDKYIFPPLNAFTSSASDIENKKAGRQEQDEISDSGEKTRSSGSNSAQYPSRK